jgi:site-specific DNA-methyltransferase (adenine-specific)
MTQETIDKAHFTLRGRNPDVLTCIANLSNDEVFTPPEFANRMLDTLAAAWAEDNNGANLWADSKVRFLDPFTKSGIFLREITTRLNEGLKDEIPDLQERVDHILTQQVYGIAITQLTSLLARRSVYCSKHANGEHSIAQSFDNDAGNIWFERTEHTWEGNKCKYCGAPKALFDRKDELETYAYAFIHTDDIKGRLNEIFGGNMQFDVVIGNPPYQMAGGAGGSSDSSIYHLFVEQAMKLEPRYLSMVTPARWLAGGRGMNEFRAEMLSSGKLRELVDYRDSKEVFPGVSVEGGIVYFLWDSAHNGNANVTMLRGKEVSGPISRDLNEFDVFVRDSRAVEILHKVQSKQEPSIIEILTGDTPFGIATNFDGWRQKEKNGDVTLHLVKSGKRLVGYLPKNEIRKNVHLIDSWKVLTPEARGGQKVPDLVLGKPMIASPESVCTQSFLAFWVDSEEEALSLQSYLSTKFFRFLVSLRKITQHALRSTYTWVPQQTWDREWTDEMMYEKYGLTQEEIDYVESVIRPMNLGSSDD